MDKGIPGEHGFLGPGLLCWAVTSQTMRTCWRQALFSIPQTRAMPHKRSFVILHYNCYMSTLGSALGLWIRQVDRYSLRLGWGGGQFHGSDKEPVKERMAVLLSVERTLAARRKIQDIHPGSFYFSSKFPILRSWHL